MSGEQAYIQVAADSNIFSIPFYAEHYNHVVSFDHVDGKQRVNVDRVTLHRDYMYLYECMCILHFLPQGEGFGMEVWRGGQGDQTVFDDLYK